MNKKLLCVSVLSLGLFACSSNQAPISGVNSQANNPVDTAPVITNNNSSDVDVHTNNNNNMNANSDGGNAVYFDFNKYDIDSQYEAVVNYNANYLAGKPGAHVKVAGNTDDIGSVEYNLALGQRRADAVKRALVAKGASAAQVEAISNGKLMAKFSNDSDDGRAKNRRADILYSKQAPAGYTTTANGVPVINQ